MRQEENASGIACEETELDQALKEIIDKEKLANQKGSCICVLLLIIHL